MTPPSSRVLDTIGELVRQLPHDLLERLCLVLEALPGEPTTTKILGITSIVVDGAARARADRAMAIWREEAPHISPQTFAWMLRSAAVADAWRENQQRIEAVWTGPGAHNTGLRRTDAALIEVINAAQDRLWIVTFAAYRVAPVMSAIKRAVARGVHVSFVGESSTENEALTSGGASVLRSYLPEEVAIYIWPHDQRELDEKGNAGALHAKLAIADGKVALVSSANLSSHALQRNIEAGTLIHGGTVPAVLESQFIHLLSAGILRLLV